ncbi:uncharacterized protein METZ01_LOCUS178759, partial [marine metagenome]
MHQAYITHAEAWTDQIMESEKFEASLVKSFNNNYISLYHLLNIWPHGG